MSLTAWFHSNALEKRFTLSECSKDLHFVINRDKVEVVLLPEYACIAGGWNISYTGQFVNVDFNADISERFDDMFWTFAKGQSTEETVANSGKRAETSSRSCSVLRKRGLNGNLGCDRQVFVSFCSILIEYLSFLQNSVKWSGWIAVEKKNGAVFLLQSCEKWISVIVSRWIVPRAQRLTEIVFPRAVPWYWRAHT